MQHVIADTTVVVKEGLYGPAVDRWRRLIVEAAELRRQLLRVTRADQVLNIEEAALHVAVVGVR